MAKKSTEPTEKTQPMTTPAAPEAAIVPQPVVQALTPVAPEFEALPEKHRANLARVIQPTTAEFSAAVKLVGPTFQPPLLDLVERMSPDKPGSHLSNDGFQPTTVKLYQGIGKDETRPAKLLPGAFYSTTSRDLSEKMVVAVLGFFDGRTLWPPKDAGTNAPVCYSLDGLAGSKYGACETCPSKKLAYTQGGCTPQFTFWFIDQAMTGVYELTFSKTSYKAGQGLARMLRDSARPWNRWVELSSNAREEGDKRWFVIKAGLLQDKNPANVDVSPDLRAVFALLNRALDVGTYYPRLSRQYGKTDNATEGNAGQELTADISATDLGGANTGL